MKGREIILTIMLTISLLTNFYLYFLREPLIKETKTEVIKRDTIIDWKYSTDTIYISQTKYRDIYHYDTIHHNNIIYIKDTLHNYRFDEQHYTLDINAVRLGNYTLDIHSKDTVCLTETIYQTIYKPKKNNFTVGLSVGYGYGLIHQKPDAFVGVTATYNIIK